MRPEYPLDIYPTGVYHKYHIPCTSRELIRITRGQLKALFIRQGRLTGRSTGRHMSQVCEIFSAHCRRIEGIFSQRQSRETREGAWSVRRCWVTGMDLLSSRGELGETIRMECTAVRRESLCGCTVAAAAVVCVCVCV